MPFTHLLWNCLAPGETAVKEEHLTARFQQRAGETILAFRLDSENFRAHFGRRDGRVCDALFFYKGRDQVPVLFFVELKGTDFGKALSQLEQTLDAFRPALKDYDTEFRAVVVMRGGVPRADKRRRKHLEEKFRVKVGVSKDGDLRQHL